MLSGRASNTANCVASGHFCHTAARAFTDVTVLQQTVLPGRVCSTEVCAASGIVGSTKDCAGYGRLYPSAAFTVHGCVCSTAVCAFPGRAKPTETCPGLSMTVQMQSVMPMNVSYSVLPQFVLPVNISALQYGCNWPTEACLPLYVSAP